MPNQPVRTSTPSPKSSIRYYFTPLGDIPNDISSPLTVRPYKIAKWPGDELVAAVLLSPDLLPLFLAPLVGFAKKQQGRMAVLGRVSCVCKAWRQTMAAQLIMAGATCKADTADLASPSSHVVYMPDTMRHLKESEAQPHVRPSPTYLKAHAPKLSAKMRTILVDWLVDVHLRFELVTETLYVAISLLDRFLAAHATVEREQLQCVGVTALFIASKYEEIYHPECRDFAVMCAGAAHKTDILAMEQIILDALDYRITVPTSFQWLTRLIKVSSMEVGRPFSGIAVAPPVDDVDAEADSDGEPKEAEEAERRVKCKLESRATGATSASLNPVACASLASYLLELSLRETSFLAYLPSCVAAAAVCLARLTLAPPHVAAWPAELAAQVGYDMAALRPCVRELRRVQAAAGSAELHAIRNKYSTAEHHKCSDVVPVAL